LVEAKGSAAVLKIRFLVPMAVAVAVAVLAVAGGPAVAADGKKVFRKACASCHSIRSEKIRAQIPPGRDLGGIGAKIDGDTLKAVIRGEATEVKRHKRFKGSDEDRQALVDWLLERTAE
jgi:mono/diheme cytochrome c family protein